jgi:hypothetical protein
MGRVESDLADDVVVELLELLNGDPELVDAGAADSVRRELLEILRVYSKRSTCPM